jgi:hypothetical protein
LTKKNSFGAIRSDHQAESSANTVSNAAATPEFLMTFGWRHGDCVDPGSLHKESIMSDWPVIATMIAVVAFLLFFNRGLGGG